MSSPGSRPSRCTAVSKLSLAALAAVLVSGMAFAKKGDDSDESSRRKKAAPVPPPPPAARSVAPSYVPPPAARPPPPPPASVAPTQPPPAARPVHGATVIVEPQPVVVQPVIVQPVVVEPAPVMVVEPRPPEPPLVPHVDLGFSGGWNNPAGILGFGLELRAIDQLAIGFGAGAGAWGTRLSPQVRLYPFGASVVGLFLEGGASLNLGGQAKATVNGAEQVIQQGFVPTANLSLGIRGQWGPFFYTSFQLGYQINLRPHAYHSADGSPMDPLADQVVQFLEPGGLIVGLATGISFL